MIQKCRRCGQDFETDRSYHRFCWSCYWADRDNGSSARNPIISPKIDTRLLRDAISLCHPDRHPAERWEKANAVTAALLEIERQQKE